MPYIKNSGAIRQKARMTLMSATPVCNLLEDDPELQKAPNVLGPLLTCAIATTVEEVVLIFEDIVNHPDVHSRENTLLNARQSALIAVKESTEQLRDLCMTVPADVKNLALANHVIAIVDPLIKKHQFHPRNGIPFERQDLWEPVEVSCSVCGYATALESPTNGVHLTGWEDMGLASLVSPAFSNKSVPCPPSLRYLKAREDKKISDDLLENLIATRSEPFNTIIDRFYDDKTARLREDSNIFHNHVREVIHAVNEILDEQ